MSVSSPVRSVREFAGLAALPFVCVLGCLSAPTSDVTKTSALPSADGAPLRAYLLRGLWDFFSQGFDTLAAELRAQRVDAVAVTGPSWPKVAASLESGFTDQSDTRPLVLAGHSYGADDAVNLARALGDRNIRVKLLYLLDATSPGPIPANVDRCVHLYMPNDLGRGVPQMFPGNPVVAEEGNSHTEIINQVFNEAELGPGVRDVTHFTIEESELAHQLISAEILKVAAEVGQTGQP